jgi:hypothetical protein
LVIVLVQTKASEWEQG